MDKSKLIIEIVKLQKNSYEIICSIDPGVTSGLCVGYINNKKVVLLKLDNFKYPTDIVEYVNIIKLCDIIIIEDFILRKFLKGSRLETVKVIGAIEFACYEAVKKIVYQQPHQKKLFPDKVLQQLNVFTKNPHINDAIRHFLIFSKFRLNHQINTL